MKDGVRSFSRVKPDAGLDASSFSRDRSRAKDDEGLASLGILLLPRLLGLASGVLVGVGV